ncbi:MAG: Trk system potassium transporter TrkA [Fidelibacterota bacterium]|nr:MAG: Trk system potassium transporter TrkA [Candidatus Neomarinimicrobiota bacterium]
MSLKIVIIGAGEVGFNLAKELSREDYDITVVDINPKKIKRASETLDVSTLEGNGASPFILRQAQVDSTDIFLALTRIDEVNLVACRMAKELGAKTIIARLRSTDYASRQAMIEPSQFGIDEVIHPELAVVGEVERLLRQSSAIDVKEFEDGRLQLVGVRLEASSPLLQRTIEDVSNSNQGLPHKVVALNHEGINFIPKGDTTYQVGDIVYVMGEAQQVPKIVTMLGKPHREVSKVMILGAGKIGRRLASRFQDEMDIKLVEANKAKAWEVAPTLVNTLVLHGDGTDIDFLISENIDEMDSFVAVTEDEQTNLLTGLLAKQLGAEHVIVHLSTTSYLPIARRIGIDAAISKNMATVEAILRRIKSSHDRAVSPFEDVEMEAVELVAEEGSKVTKKSLKEINFPADVVLGAIMKTSGIEIASGDSSIEPGDRVLLFMQNVEVDKILKYFT